MHFTNPDILVFKILLCQRLNQCLFLFVWLFVFALLDVRTMCMSDPAIWQILIPVCYYCKSIYTSARFTAKKRKKKKILKNLIIIIIIMLLLVFGPLPVGYVNCSYVYLTGIINLILIKKLLITCSSKNSNWIIFELWKKKKDCCIGSGAKWHVR